jgi:hypothetical protein
MANVPNSDSHFRFELVSAITHTRYKKRNSGHYVAARLRHGMLQRVDDNHQRETIGIMDPAAHKWLRPCTLAVYRYLGTFPGRPTPAESSLTEVDNAVLTDEDDDTPMNSDGGDNPRITGTTDSYATIVGFLTEAMSIATHGRMPGNAPSSHCVTPGIFRTRPEQPDGTANVAERTTRSTRDKLAASEVTEWYERVAKLCDTTGTSTISAAHNNGVVAAVQAAWAVPHIRFSILRQLQLRGYTTLETTHNPLQSPILEWGIAMFCILSVAQCNRDSLGIDIEWQRNWEPFGATKMNSNKRARTATRSSTAGINCDAIMSRDAEGWLLHLVSLHFPESTKPYLTPEKFKPKCEDSEITLCKIVTALTTPPDPRGSATLARTCTVCGHNEAKQVEFTTINGQFGVLSSERTNKTKSEQWPTIDTRIQRAWTGIIKPKEAMQNECRGKEGTAGPSLTPASQRQRCKAYCSMRVITAPAVLTVTMCARDKNKRFITNGATEAEERFWLPTTGVSQSEQRETEFILCSDIRYDGTRLAVTAFDPERAYSPCNTRPLPDTDSPTTTIVVALYSRGTSRTGHNAAPTQDQTERAARIDTTKADSLEPTPRSPEYDVTEPYQWRSESHSDPTDPTEPHRRITVIARTTAAEVTSTPYQWEPYDNSLTPCADVGEPVRKVVMELLKQSGTLAADFFMAAILGEPTQPPESTKWTRLTPNVDGANVECMHCLWDSEKATVGMNWNVSNPSRSRTGTPRLADGVDAAALMKTLAHRAHTHVTNTPTHPIVQGVVLIACPDTCEETDDSVIQHGSIALTLSRMGASDPRGHVIGTSGTDEPRSGDADGNSSRSPNVDTPAGNNIIGHEFVMHRQLPGGSIAWHTILERADNKDEKRWAGMLYLVLAADDGVGGLRRTSISEHADPNGELEFHHRVEWAQHGEDQAYQVATIPQGWFITPRDQYTGPLCVQHGAWISTRALPGPGPGP